MTTQPPTIDTTKHSQSHSIRSTTSKTTTASKTGNGNDKEKENHPGNERDPVSVSTDQIQGHDNENDDDIDDDEEVVVRPTRTRKQRTTNRRRIVDDDDDDDDDVHDDDKQDIADPDSLKNGACELQHYLHPVVDSGRKKRVKLTMDKTKIPTNMETTSSKKTKVAPPPPPPPTKKVKVMDDAKDADDDDDMNCDNDDDDDDDGNEPEMEPEVNEPQKTPKVSSFFEKTMTKGVAKSESTVTTSSTTTTKKGCANKESAAAARPTESFVDEPLSYLVFCNTMEQIEAISGRLEIQALLTNLFCHVISSSTPTDLYDLVYLSSNSVAPSYECIELGIGDAILIKAIGEAYGTNPCKFFYVILVQ